MSLEIRFDAREAWLPEPFGQLAGSSNGAFSASTERALRSDLALFSAWCSERGLQALPAAAETVAGFVEAMAERRAPATVRRYVTSISIAHRMLGCTDASKDETARLALKRMHRQKGRRQDQARGLTLPLRIRLLDAAGGRLIDDRNRALLAVAYDTLLRRAELSALQVEDLFEETDGDATLLVRCSKTDQEGKGETVWVAPDSMKLVRIWLGRAGFEGGPLFRSVSRSGRIGGALPPGQVARIFKAMAREAGLPEAEVRDLSGHSTRVGAAQDMIAIGLGMPAVQQAGRWKSVTMVSRYCERPLARYGGAAQLARRQGRA